MCTDVPEADPNIGLAALRTAELGDKAFDWFTSYYETELGPAQRELAALNKQATGQALRIAAQQEERASDQYAYQKETFRPVEEALAREAVDFNRSDYRDRQAAAAGAEVQAAFAASDAQLNRDLARMGVNPNAGQALQMRQGSALARAANMAGASNAARENADAVGFARLQTAAGLGRGISSDATTNAQVALSAGNSGSQIAGSTLNSARQNAQTVGQGYQTAIGANAQAGGLWAESSRQNQNAATVNGQSASNTIGTVAGAAIGAFMLSSRKSKKDIERIDDDAALEITRKTPVSTYQYKEGRGDEQRHVGPMADDVAKVSGSSPEYVDIGDQLGIQLAAIRALDRRVRRLAEKEEKEE